MKHFYRLYITAFLCLAVSILHAQTSWKGTSSSSWTNYKNWTAGVPTASIDAILGDANFTGSFQPNIGHSAACRSLTIGGAHATILTVSRNLGITGSCTINSNGTLSHGTATITLAGNWNNSGTYSANNSGALLVFTGVAATLGGSSATTFRKLTINTASVVTLTNNITVSGTSNLLSVLGTLDPGVSPGLLVTAGSLTVGASGLLRVTAATFAGNYSASVTLNASSIVEYTSTTLNQTISSALTYGTLRINGAGTTKSLSANLPALASSLAGSGNISVSGGTLDLQGFTANRGSTVTGGTLSVASGATLKIGGTNTMPANFNTRNLALASTVEYSGTNQTVAAVTYGNLTLSNASGAGVKTLPATALTIAGNLTSTVSGGASVSFTAAAALTVSGNLILGASTTFNGGSFTHSIVGNWTNNGTYNANTSTLTFAGDGGVISGTGANNFNNLSFTGSQITAVATTALTVAGNISTSGSGTFTHLSGGTTTLTGTSKTIGGAGLSFDNLTVTGTISTNTLLIVTGNLSVTGTFTATAGSVTMSGVSKSISGAGGKSFSSLNVTGTVAAAADFSIASALTVTGTLTATAGTATFTGSSSLNGTANLFNITLNGTSLHLSSDAILGIAGAYTLTAGTLDVTSSTPNTVSYNGTGAQSVNGGTYHHLILSNGNTKTALAAITINGNLSIATATTFSAGSFTHTFNGNWTNNGSFTAGTSTVTFAGTLPTNITGATTFATLTLNKASNLTVLTLQNNVSVATVNMTSGQLSTGTNTLTITTTRTGNGIILGNIQRTHAFSTGTAYAFESPQNTITFSILSGVTSITVSVTKGAVGGFPFGSAVNRTYNIAVPAGTYSATLQLHYEDAELNGNVESTLGVWNYNGTVWNNNNSSSNNTTTNFVSLAGVTSLAQPWTLSDVPNVTRWTGAVSTDWNSTGNWLAVQGAPGSVPTANDIVQIGTAAFSNPPTITTAANASSIQFGSTQAATLTLASGGSLTTAGNISGAWSSNATHTINVGAQTLSIGGSLTLSDGTAGHAINLGLSSGAVTVAGTLTQSGGAAVNCTGNGTLNIGGDYLYTSGPFTPGTGTVTYNGTNAQVVAGLTYDNLAVNNAGGIASLNTPATAQGSLTVSAGTLDLNAATTVTGNVSIGSGTTLIGDGITATIGGNWTNNGSFIPGSGTVQFNSAGAQSISASTFNNLIINSTGTATLGGNITVNSDLTLSGGNFDLSTFTANRATVGGNLNLSNGTTLLAGGAANFPGNFDNNNLATGSTVNYYSSTAQSVAGVPYGNLVLSNSGLKTLAGAATVNGDLTIGSGASLSADINTLTLGGNWNNNGTFVPVTGNVILTGSGKTVTGNTSFNMLTVYGSYSVAGSNITYNGLLTVANGASYDAGSGTATVNADLTNDGTLTSSGTINFTGNNVQNIRLEDSLMATSASIVNFNGTVAPLISSTSKPTFATLNINNTGGVTANSGWVVGTSFTIAGGSSFDGGSYTQRILGSFTNNGTVSSSGTLLFEPATAVNCNVGSAFSSTGTVHFGGSGAISMTGTPAFLQNVIISNTSAGGFTPFSGWTVNGTFSVRSNAIFNAGSFSYTLAGDIESDGAINGGTSTFTMTSPAGSILASPLSVFNNFTITGNLTATSDFQVAGNFINNGSLDASIGALVMTGGTPATISGSSYPLALAQLEIHKDFGVTVTPAGSLGSIASLHISGGILDAGAMTLGQDAVNGGDLTIEDSAALRIGGTNTLPVFTTYSFDTLSTVEYAGSTQSIPATTPYGNLIISASGVKTPAAALTILNNFTLANGTFAGGAFTHTVGGDWTMTSGTFTNTGTTILLNGIDTQFVNSTGAFSNLTVNKATGLVGLTGNITVNNTLSLAAGKISLQNSNLTMGSAGTIIGASAANYLIARGTGALVWPVGSGSSKAFPIGTAANYTPATVALTAGSTADNIAMRVIDTVYYTGTSGNTVQAGAVNATWMISEGTAGGSNATVTLQWPGALEMPGFIRSASRLAHFTGGGWDYGTVDLSATGTDPYTVSRSGFTSFSPFAVSSFGALPITWLDVTGNNVGPDNDIYWSTAIETNNDHFEIETSVDGKSFITIGKTPATNHTTGVEDYSFVHHNAPAGRNFYRIRQVDRDGQFSYSKTITIFTGSVANSSIFYVTNPVTDQVTAFIQSSVQRMATILVIDAGGRILETRPVSLSVGSNRLDIPFDHRSKGMYYLQYIDEHGDKQIKKVVKE